MSSAWPVPTATTRTLMPVFFVNSGRMWPNKPDCSVDVVEATVIDLSCAAATPASIAPAAIETMAKTAVRRLSAMAILL